MNSVPLLGNDEMKCVSTLRCNHVKLSLSRLLRHMTSHQDKSLFKFKNPTKIKPPLWYHKYRVILSAFTKLHKMGLYLMFCDVTNVSVPSSQNLQSS